NVLKDVGEFGKGLRSELEELEGNFKVKQGEYERRLKELEESYGICLASKKELERITKMYPNIEDISRGLDEGTVEESLRKLEEYERNKGEIEKTIKELEEIQKTLEGEEFKDLDNRLNGAKEVLREVEERINSLRAEREGIINGIRGLEGRIYEKQPKYEELKKTVREFEEAKEGIERVSRFKYAVEEAKKTFINLAKLEFEKALNIYFLDRFGFSNRYTRIEVDENFEPVFHTREGSVISRGRSLSVNEVGLSGGERTALGLAYRLALRELIGDIPKILLLDEPTTHMDADRRLAVWGILKDIAERDNIQIIAVTHDDAVEDVVERENIIRLAS
ncbi:MAG: AAA family ATPase, partial [candidate division WOR-3 bacterium]